MGFSFWLGHATRYALTSSIWWMKQQKLSALQIEIHPYFRNDALINFCKEHEIHVTAYSPLGGAPETEDLVKKTLPKLLEDVDVVNIAGRLNKSPAQVRTTSHSVLSMEYNCEFMYLWHLKHMKICFFVSLILQ